MTDFLHELFGDVIYSYPDSQAIADGILIPFVVKGRDTHHRITANAYEGLKEHYAPSYTRYEDADFYRFFFAELLPLLPEAYRRYAAGDILTTEFGFRVTKYETTRDKQLWYIPNELGGITMMRPSDW